MTPFAALLAVCAASAFAALVLSGTRWHRAAGRLARFSLWATVAAPVVALASILSETPAADASSKAYVLARVISSLMSYAAALVPTALMASVALKRSRTARAR